MLYSLEKSYEILERTPAVLKALLSGLSEEWILNNEGPETFSPYDVAGHLVHGEKTDWAVRIKRILNLVIAGRLTYLTALHNIRIVKGNLCCNYWMNLKSCGEKMYNGLNH